MSANLRDLWPEFLPGQNGHTPPIVILREQASLLEGKTNGLVKASVNSNKMLGDLDWSEKELDDMLSGDRSKSIIHSFWLIAPSLENYRYRLFRVIQPIEMYPLDVIESPIGEIKAASEDQLLAALRNIFTSEKTQRVITALMVQSVAA